jgi:glutathione synthase/RimK-type ligase-like ATP-grasp enzyme
MTILILTHRADVHADAVQQCLEADGIRVARLDTAQLGPGPGKYPVSALLSRGAVLGYLGDCDLSRVTCVWHRRPADFTATGEPNNAELRAGVGGVLAGLRHLNHPADMARAGLKAFQLRAAGQCGLMVPETLVSTQLQTAEEFSAKFGHRVIVKPMSRSVPELVRATGRQGWGRAIHLTQQLVDTREFIRLTVVDDTFYAVKITATTLDWRESEATNKYMPVTAPPPVSLGVGRLMRRLWLRYAALDFALDHLGNWWFLEANPNGQWLWVEEKTGLPISGAVAMALRR